LSESKIDREYLNFDKNPKPLLDDYPGILALKLDIMLGKSKDIKANPINRQFIWKLINKCTVNKVEFLYL